MEFIHEPVLLQEVLEWMDVKPDGVYCDGTLGGGGHSGAMLRLSGGTATLYGIDRDMTAIEAATARLREFPGFHAPARQFPRWQGASHGGGRAQARRRAA